MRQSSRVRRRRQMDTLLSVNRLWLHEHCLFLFRLPPWNQHRLLRIWRHKKNPPPYLHLRPTINKDCHCTLIKLWDVFWLGCQLSKALSTSLPLPKQTRRSKVNPLRSSHLSSGAADSLLFMAHPEGLSTNGIHMISISSGRQEPAFQHISFLLQRTQSRHRATAGGKERKERTHS